MNQAILVEKQNATHTPFKKGPVVASTTKTVTATCEGAVLVIGASGVDIKKFNRSGIFPKNTIHVCSPGDALALLAKQPDVDAIVVLPHNIGGTSVCDEILVPTIKGPDKKTLKRKPFVGRLIIATDSPKIQRGYAGGGEIVSLSRLNTALARALNK